MKAYLLGFALIVAIACVPEFALRASGAPIVFTLASSNLKDGGGFSAAQIGTSARCGGGKSHSPELTWSGVPKGVQSYAVLVFDADARKGSGFVHWVAYGIPASVTEVREGAATPGFSPYVGGLNTTGAGGYFGLCPPAGDSTHHYLITVYALDLAPDVLPAGLTRDELLTALRKHILAASSIVGLYRIK